MRRTALISCLLAVVLLLSGCGTNLGETGKGTAPKIEIDGTSVVVGTTKLSALLDAGFVKSEIYRDNSLKNNLDARTLSTGSYYIAKDNKQYGSIKLVNDQSASAGLKDCIIHTVSYLIYVDGVSDNVDPDDPYGIERGSMLINGVDYAGYTPEQVKEEMSGAELTKDEGDLLMYQDGDFITEFHIGDRDTVQQVIVKIKIKTTLVIK